MYSTDPKVIDRAVKATERKAVKQLRDEISARLSTTDKRLVAHQCKSDEHEVRRVLWGDKEDSTMMSLLYARATGNKLLRKSFYTLEGAELLLKELNKQ